MCTVLLPLGGYPIAVNKYIIYRTISYHIIRLFYNTFYATPSFRSSEDLQGHLFCGALQLVPTVQRLASSPSPFHPEHCNVTLLRNIRTYESDSNENIKFFLSRNLLNTKGTQRLHLFYVVPCCHLSATLQTISVTVETYKTIELWFEILSHF